MKSYDSSSGVVEVGRVQVLGHVCKDLYNYDGRYKQIVYEIDAVFV